MTFYPSPIDYKLLRKRLNPNTLEFETTNELKLTSEFIGQERAIKAIYFGIGIQSVGYNLYAMGPPGIGKRALIKTLLTKVAGQQVTPYEWCYIHNFSSPDKPIAISLPPGVGSTLQQDMKDLIDALSTEILSVFESDEYRSGMQLISDDFELKRQKLQKAPVKTKNNNKISNLYSIRHEQEKDLTLRFTQVIIEPLITKLKLKYKEFDKVSEYLTALQEDIFFHINDFVKPDELNNTLAFSLENPILLKYQINLLVDHSNDEGAPVIFEENPSYNNLIGRVEHCPQMGSMITNFSLIRPGSLHKANGGYLILEAHKISKDKNAWEGLKRALVTEAIKIEPVSQVTESIKHVTLDPMTIPLQIKVILLGSRSQYYALSNNDPDFSDLFKVAVDFDEAINRTAKNIHLYARMIGTIVRREGLKPFHASAVAEIIDYSTRLADDVEKLSTNVAKISDIILEADYWASEFNKKIVEDIDVQQAIVTQIQRMDRAKDLYYEEINRNFIIIDTSNEVIGQVNCLSVVKIGKFSYGHPTRITANVQMGQSKIIDIQREVKLAGAMHSKAGLIISHYLTSRYNKNHFNSLVATISFEQIYGMLDGDSASVGEICAILSELAEVPIKQYLAITGSINLKGEMQSVGKVNEKIEGFFDICNSRGLTGKEGVIIPTINMANLMLKDEIILAARAHKFSIYTADTVDQAITLLTGMAAGERNEYGEFDEGTLNYKVEQKLKLIAKNYILDRKIIKDDK